MTFGIEEEVFVVQRGKPSLESFFCLARLLWREQYFNYFHTAHNFSHLPDLKNGLMGSVEISTEVCYDIDSLMQALLRRRKELADVTSSLLVPVGHLFEENSPTRTCGLHIHVGDIEDMGKAYWNVAHFLPLLLLLTASSPLTGGRYFGPSYRVYSCPFIGPLKGDLLYRFQDLILSRRLRTLEVRVFDSVWDISRIRVLVELIAEIVKFPGVKKFDPALYQSARNEACEGGFGELTGGIFRELRELRDVPEALFSEPPSLMLYDYYFRNGRDRTFSALDNAYRNGVFEPHLADGNVPNPLKVIAGLAGYFLPKLPHAVWKSCREIAL